MRANRIASASRLAEKIDQALEAKKPRRWKPADLARILADRKALGLTEDQWLSRIKNYRTRARELPDDEVIDALADALRVEPRWLRSPDAKPIEWRKSASNVEPDSDGEPDDYTAFLVPYFGQVPAGDWERPEPGDAPEIQFSNKLRERLLQAGIKLSTIVSVRVRGLSMSPGFADGALVLIRLTKEKVDNVVVLALNQDNELTLKLLKYVKGQWELHSTNPDYPPISAERVEIIGHAIHREETDLAGLRA